MLHLSQLLNQDSANQRSYPGDAIYPVTVSCGKQLCPVNPRRKRAVKSGFHYRKAVAPLKLANLELVLQELVGFPLPKGGGPIEALSRPLG